MKKLLLILCTLILILGACTSNEEKVKKQELQTKQSESERQKAIEEKAKERQKVLNDSLTKNLLERFPTALKLDSIKWDPYTYYFQELLEKSSNFLFINTNIIDLA
jgi:ABC-type enterochelin transport system substrate-binding protein